ncbi:AraC family transcriptional regulator [Paenibacillus sp. 2RAB27]|uniref:helix-turn-helix transcriptional regulator n=1 Tax=Paenibacillus sp. 2RAB27 TaxID=3232991 RepID=UPI003F960F67
MAWQENGAEFYEMIPHIPSALERQIGVWVLTSGRNRAKSTYRVGPRHFTYYSLHIILSGELHLSFRGDKVVLKRGDLFCMHPDETYEYEINPSGTELQMAWIAFHGPLAAAQLQLTQLSAVHPYIHNGVTRELIAILDTIRELIAQQLDQPLLLAGRLMEFLHLLVVTSSSNDSSSSHSLPTWLERGKSYMDVHFAEGITVEQVSDWLGISRSHFSKAFSKHMNTNPSNYLQRLRMREARRQLLESTYSITEIALSLGYGDLFAFTRAFTLFYGTAPKHYRDKHCDLEKYDQVML